MPLGNSGINPGTEGSDPARKLQDAVRRGESFSGNERHVVYQNRSGDYVDVSGITGLDLPDDGRAACFTDWDRDGDLDLWVSNRSAPQVRYFENQNPSAGVSLSLKLIGKTANRDAIGARVVLEVEGQPTQTRFVSAGSGFLAQSSKTLHFGLGKNKQIPSLTIHWPGDPEPQRIANLPFGRHVIIQGEMPSEPAQRSVASHEVTKILAPANRTILAAPLPVATLFKRPADDAGKVYLVAAEEASANGQVVHDHPYDIKNRALPSPPSFLVDADDQLRAIYHSAPSPKQFAVDVAALSSDPGVRRSNSLPFSGRWESKAVPKARPLSLVEDLLDAGRIEAAEKYIENYRSILQEDAVYPALIGRLKFLQQEAMIDQ